MKKRQAEVLILAAALSFGCACAAPADIVFAPDVMQAYNTAVQGQDVLDGLDVDVTEKTVSTKTNVISEKQIDLQVSGITEDNLKGTIRVTSSGDVNTDEEVIYTDGWYYYTQDGKKLKKELSRDGFWKIVNSQIYLDMNSSYLQTLYSTTDSTDGTVTYIFSATDETIGDYNEKLLDHLTAEQGNVSIKTLQGNMTVDSEGHVTGRDITMTYVAGSGEDQETFVKSSHAVYNQTGTVNVTLPSDLSSYTEAVQKQAATFTEASGTVYATAGINVRSAGSLEATVIGGVNAGDGMAETGYTSDGWIQIQYQGQTGYVWAEYTSRTRPVITSGASGTMYATADVNIRSGSNAESQVLGVLKTGSSISITGTTNTGWTRVTYNGKTAYIYSSYLSWTAPVNPNYVENAVTTGTVTDVGIGSLTLSSGLSFDTTYAQYDIQDSVNVGDTVTVTYTGSASPYTAGKIVDESSHFTALPEDQGDEDDTVYDEADDEEIMETSGVITQTDGWNYVNISCDDGVYREFDISDAVIGASDLSNGDYITISWTTDNPDQVKNLQADVVE